MPLSQRLEEIPDPYRHVADASSARGTRREGSNAAHDIATPAPHYVREESARAVSTRENATRVDAILSLHLFQQSIEEGQVTLFVPSRSINQTGGRDHNRIRANDRWHVEVGHKHAGRDTCAVKTEHDRISPILVVATG